MKDVINGKNRTIGEMSIDTRLLYDRLKKAEVGEIITYEELAETIGGRGVQAGDGKAYPNLKSAIRKCLMDDSFVFEAVINVGIKRLEDQAIILSSDRSFEKTRREIRRSRKKLTCIQDFDSLPNLLKVKHNTALAIFGILQHVTTTSKIAKLEKHIGKEFEDKKELMATAKTLEFFQKNT